MRPALCSLAGLELTAMFRVTGDDMFARQHQRRWLTWRRLPEEAIRPKVRELEINRIKRHQKPNVMKPRARRDAVPSPGYKHVGSDPRGEEQSCTT
jgi:hypothetical protein